MYRAIRDWLAPAFAVDLGSANTRISVAGRGLALDEPSVVAVNHTANQVLGRGAAVGKLARQMLGRTPENIQAVQPIQHGVITDFELCEALLRYFLQKAGAGGWSGRPTVWITAPGKMTPVETRALLGSMERAGAGRIHLVTKARAAALGSGLAITEPLAHLVCDVGAGTTEIAVFSLAEPASARSLKVAGDTFDAAIQQLLRRRHGLRVGLPTAEQIKRRIGSAWPVDQEHSTEVRGLDVVSGVPRRLTVTSEEIRTALEEPLAEILDGIKSVIETCQPELVADLADTGLMLSGGGALLPGMASFFREHLGVPVRIAADPLRTAIQGAAICAERGRRRSAA